MYASVRDRPVALAPDRTGRVAATVVLLGIVSLLTDVSSEMVNAVLPLYLTTTVGMGLLAYCFVDGLYQGSAAWSGSPADQQGGVIRGPALGPDQQGGVIRGPS